MKEIKKESIEGEDAMNQNRVHKNYYALAPILKSEACVGIFRFYLSDRKLSPASWAMKLYSAVLVTAYLAAFIIFLRLPAVITGQDGFIHIMEEIPSFVIMFQYVTITLSTSFFLSEPNMEIINTFIEIDEQHMKINYEFYENQRNAYIKYLIFLCILHSIIFIVDMAFHDNIEIGCVIVFPLYLIQKLEILVFCIYMGMMKYRLIIINGYLAKFLEEKANSNISVFTLCDRTVALNEINMIGRPSEHNMKIRDLAMLYNKLGATCFLINKVYNFQIFMSLVSTFIYIVITIWTSLYYYRSSENNLGPLITVTLWCFTSILAVAVMCFVCEKLRLVRNSTKILVNQIVMDYDLPKAMRVQAKAFMELIEAWPLRIFIYDMFSVDITLMLKFISVATTYLIVILQIRSASN